MNIKYDKLVKENQRLNEENKYLRKILQLNNIQYNEYTPIEEKQFSKEDKIKIYLSYFKEKNDIYEERYYKNVNYYMKIVYKNVINFSKQNQFTYF